MKLIFNLIVAVTAIFIPQNLHAQDIEKVGESPWGPKDEIGTLNMMTQSTKMEILSKVSSGKTYDLSFEYFVGMPSLHSFGLGDPSYQFWMAHTPNGTVVDNPNEAGKKINEKISYTGDAIMMPTHTGAHIDALNHFGLNGKIWNGFTANEHLGDKGWKKAGTENIPPIIARGILIDLASSKGVEVLEQGYRATTEDLEAALKRQNISLQRGDVVLIRTGQGRRFKQGKSYLNNYPGVSLKALKWLVEENKIMLLGADNLSLETLPSSQRKNWIPGHTYLLVEQGLMFIENMNLEELAEDQVYKFVFIAASLKLRGASGAPMRPLAIPIK